MLPSRTVIATCLALALVSPAALAQAPAPPAPPPAPSPEAAEAERAAREASRLAREVSRQVHEAVRVETERLHAGEAKGDPYTEKISRVLKAGPDVTVVVQNISGYITVSGAGAQDVRVDATKRTRAMSPEQGKAQLARVDVRINEHANRIEISTPIQRHDQDKWGKGKYNVAAVDFDIVVPTGASLELRSVSGDLTVSGVKGLVNAETVSGDVSATSLTSESSLKTVSGDVMVSASKVTGDLSANSVSGDVTAKGLKARAVNAGTVSGNIALHDAWCERATVKSLSGNLEVSGPLAKAARYELKSHSGNVRVVVDGKTGFELDATTWSGMVSSELPLKTAASGDGGQERRRLLQGTFGDASAKIEATSFSGNVVVAKLK